MQKRKEDAGKTCESCGMDNRLYETSSDPCTMPARAWVCTHCRRVIESSDTRRTRYTYGPQAPIVGECDSCEDIGPIATLNGKNYCKECYEEIASGIIRNQNISICGGGKSWSVDQDPDAFGKNYGD